LDLWITPCTFYKLNSLLIPNPLLRAFFNISKFLSFAYSSFV